MNKKVKNKNKNLITKSKKTQKKTTVIEIKYRNNSE